MWLDLLTAYNGSEITYDAWGKPLSSTGDLADINPLRYRGYYYDAELEMYYLKFRYYDPDICRFINADDVSNLGANSDVSSLNLFAYCGNNPVKYDDQNGEWIDIAIGAVVGGLIGGFSAAIQGGNVADIMGGAVSGALSGGLCAAGGEYLIWGSAFSGIYTAITSEGSVGERLTRGSVAFGSTLFWGSFGNTLVREIEDVSGKPLGTLSLILILSLWLNFFNRNPSISR